MYAIDATASGKLEATFKLLKASLGQRSNLWFAKNILRKSTRTPTYSTQRNHNTVSKYAPLLLAVAFPSAHTDSVSQERPRKHAFCEVSGSFSYVPRYPAQGISTPPCDSSPTLTASYAFGQLVLGALTSRYALSFGSCACNITSKPGLPSTAVRCPPWHFDPLLERPVLSHVHKSQFRKAPSISSIHRTCFSVRGKPPFDLSTNIFSTTIALRYTFLKCASFSKRPKGIFFRISSNGEASTARWLSQYL